VLQGASADFAQASALALIVSTFEAGAARNRAVGVFAALEGLGQRARTAARWRARPGRLLALGFFVNVPIAALVAALAPRYIPWPSRIALPGAATATSAIGLT